MSSAILCGVDGTRPSLVGARLARRLGRASGRPVRYVYIAPPVAASYARTEVEAVHERLAEAVGRDAALRVMTGMPAQRLAESTRQASMLVLGTRGPGALRHAIAGSVTATVTRTAAAPVLVVPGRPGDARLPGDVDGAIVCGVRDEGDLPCAATSAWLARELDVPLILAHVVPPPRLPVAAAGGAPPAALIHSAAERAAAAGGMLDDLAGAIAPSAPTECSTLILTGAVAQELDRVAASEGALLVALGPHRRRGLRGVLSASLARRLMRRRRAVLVCPAPDRVFAHRPYSGAEEPGRPESVRPRARADDDPDHA